MANGSNPPEHVDHARIALDAVTAQLGERVTNLGRRQSDLESEMRNGFQQVDRAISAFTNETRTSLATLSTTIAERNKPQWQALGVLLAAVLAIGALAYWPIRDSNTDLKTKMAALEATGITRAELDFRAGRSAEDRGRMEEAIGDLRAGMTPRNEWQERNMSRDHEIANLQRQLDQQRTDFMAFSNSLGNGRDVLVQMRDEIIRLENQVSELRMRQAQVMGQPRPALP